MINDKIEILEKDSDWHEILKKKIDDNTDYSELIAISKFRSLPSTLRPSMWQILLEVATNSDPFAFFDELYDLNEQDIIHVDCQQLINENNFNKNENLQMLSDVESIFTLLCKRKNIQYTTKSAIFHLFKPLLHLGLHRSKLYNILYAILSKYIPREFENNEHSYHLFRLLLFYHDPELAAFFDTKRVPADKYAFKWFATLFSSHCQPNVTLSVWDVYLQQKDPYFIYFLALVIVINARDQILLMNGQDKLEIIEKLNSFPAALEEDDIDDFCTLARYYSAKTPSSFRDIFYVQIFDEQTINNEITIHELCLHINCTEILHPKSNLIDSINFLLIDCRPLRQFEAGHLSSSYHLDANLMLNDPTEFASKIKDLHASLIFNTSSNSEGVVVSNQHLCFLGTGNNEDEQYTYMVVSHFLQKYTQYVSVCLGGFIALHDAMKNTTNMKLELHDPLLCAGCNQTINSHPDHTVYTSDGLLQRFGQLSSVMKNTTFVVKEKMINYIKNEPSTVVRHVSSTDKVGKRYRGTSSIFTIDDNEDDVNGEQSSEGETSEEIDIITWIGKNSSADTTFYCTHVNRDNKLKHAVICISGDKLVIFFKAMEDGMMGRIYAKRPLIDILKITSKRRQPEFITIKYGHPIPDVQAAGKKKVSSCVVTQADRLIIEKAGDATKAIKLAIMRIIDV